MNSIQFNLARIIGPTIGRVFVHGSWAATWCFLLNGISFIAVIISLYLIHVKYVPPKSHEPVMDSMRAGIRFIRRREGMEPLVALAFCTTLLGFSLNGFLPVFVREVFNRGPETYTLLLVCSGLGAVLGGLIVAWLGRLRHQGRTALLILTVLGTFIAGFARSHWLALSCALLFAAARPSWPRRRSCCRWCS